jgi:hypothetical protein
MQGGAPDRLVVRRGPQVDRAFPLLKETITLGRDAANDIVIADPEVSRHHARLVRQPDGSVVLEDLGSTNGTYINGQRLLGPRPLRHGDQVGLGETIVLLYQAPSAEPDATLIGAPGTRPGITPPVRPPMVREAPLRPPAATVVVPQDEVEPPPERSSTRNLAIGCGCLLLACVLCAIGAYAFDALNLYPIFYPLLCQLTGSYCQ